MNRWQFALPDGRAVPVPFSSSPALIWSSTVGVGGGVVAGAGTGAAEIGAPKAAAAAGGPCQAGQVSALQVSARPYLLALVLACGAYVYLWWSAGRGAGTWWWPAWYGAALLQGVAAIMLLLGSGAVGAASTLLLLVCCSAPLLHVVLFETVTEQPDRGDGRVAWADSLGKAVSAAALACAVIAAVLMVRRGSSAD